MAGDVGAQGSERGKGARAPVDWKVSCRRLDQACPKRFPPRYSVVRRRLDSHQHRSGLRMGSRRAGRRQEAAVRMGGVGRGGSPVGSVGSVGYGRTEGSAAPLSGDRDHPPSLFFPPVPRALC